MSYEARTFARSQAARKGWALRRGSWEEYVFLQDSSDRLAALARIASSVESDAQYWELVSLVWTLEESPGDKAFVWRGLLSASRAGRDAMMSDDERRTLASMTMPLTIYRGAGTSEFADGFSWTVRLGVAEAFARRFSPPTGGVLITGKIERAGVVAYLTGCREDEVLVLPGTVTISSVEPAESASGSDASGPGSR